MKITTLKENLNNGLSIIGRVSGKNLTLSILNNVLISAQKNILNLSVTDLELAIKHWFLVKTEREGEITVPAKALSGFINLLPEKRVTLEAKDHVLCIDCENYKTKIKGLSAEEFPIIPKIENKEFTEIGCSSFCEAISQVVDFCAPNQVRPELSGVYFSFQEDRLLLAATDSFRLAEKIIFLDKKINKKHSFILPQKSARELINIFSGKKDKTRVYFSENQALFECLMEEMPHPQTQLISRLIEGEYPDYQGIIPQNYETQVVLSKSNLLNQIKTASIFSGKTNEIRIGTDADKKGVEIFSQDPEVGENKSFLTGDINYNISPQKETKVSFNHRFLAEGLSNIRDEEVVLWLNGEDGPALLRPAKDQSYLYVVMPIKAS